MRGALVIVTCLLAAACASAPAPRPLANGFADSGGVADPYADGKRHLDGGNYGLAAQRFGQALAQDRRSLDALNGLAIAYTRLGRFDSAHSQFERALQIDPTSALTLNNYGWSLLEQGRLREARAFLELARRHATEAEAPVIATNIQNLGRAQPPALVAALEEDRASQLSRAPHRLVRVDDDAYRLETTAEPVEPFLRPSGARDTLSAPVALEQDGAAAIGLEEQLAPPDPLSAPSLTAARLDPDEAASAAPEQSPPLGPGPDVAPRPSRGGPIQLWLQPASEPEAGRIPAGDEE